MTSSTTMTSRAGPSRPGLTCRLFGHKNPPGGRWNGSYCFGACPRCGSDLVRTAKSGWSAPRGYKVVWKPAPEEHLKVDARQPAEAPQRDTPLFDWEPKPSPTAVEAEQAPAEEQPDEQLIETAGEIIAAHLPAVPEWPLLSPAPTPEPANLPEEELVAAAADVTEDEPLPSVADVTENEPVTAPVAVVEEPSSPVLKAPDVRDFMDESDDEDWDDLAPAPQSAAPR